DAQISQRREARRVDSSSKEEWQGSGERGRPRKGAEGRTVLQLRSPGSQASAATLSQARSHAGVGREQLLPPADRPATRRARTRQRILARYRQVQRQRAVPLAKSGGCVAQLHRNGDGAGRT